MAVMRKSRNLFWLLSVLCLAGAPFWWPMVTDFLSPRRDFLETKSNNMKGREFSMDDIVFSQHKNGEVDLEVQAKELLTAGNELKLQMRKVDAVLYDKERRPFHVSGGKAYYDTEAQLLRMRDNVEVLSPDGYRLSTESLQYSSKTNRVENDQPVAISGRQLSASGTGIRLDIDTGDFMMKGGVRVVSGMGQ